MPFKWFPFVIATGLPLNGVPNDKTFPKISLLTGELNIHFSPLRHPVWRSATETEALT